MWEEAESAAKGLDADKLRQLAGTKPNLFCKWVHHVAQHGDVVTLSLLYQTMDLTIFVNNEKENVLYTASCNGQSQTVAFLLQTSYKKELWKQSNIAGQTALHAAVKHHHLPIVEQLLQACPHLMMVSNQAGCNPFQIAIKTQFHEALVSMVAREPKIVSSLTERKENVLHLAVPTNCLKLLSFLVDVCPKSYIMKRSHELTPFQLAIEFELLDIVKLFLRHCPNVVNVNACGGFELPPFFVAATCNSEEIFHYLVEHFPHVIHQRDSQGRSVLFHLTNVRTAEILVEKEPRLLDVIDFDNRVAAHDYVSRGDVEMLQFFLQRVPKALSYIDVNGETLLQYAAYHRIDNVRCCIDVMLTTKPDTQDLDRNNNNALHIAVRAGSAQVIAKVLASRVSNLHCKNYDGKTPMHLAIQNNHQEAIAMFLPHLTLDTAIDIETAFKKSSYIDLRTQCRELCDKDINAVLMPDLTYIVQQYTGLILDTPNTKKRTRDSDCINRQLFT